MATKTQATTIASLLLVTPKTMRDSLEILKRFAEFNGHNPEVCHDLATHEREAWQNIAKGLQDLEIN